jgi:hypothetical protein
MPHFTNNFTGPMHMCGHRSRFLNIFESLNQDSWPDARHLLMADGACREFMQLR